MNLDPDQAQLFRRASREPLYPQSARTPFPLDTTAIEDLIPHRDPIRLVDRVTALSRAPDIIVCERDLAPTDPIFAGHFPGSPIYPGVLQIEAIGQAGILLHRLLTPPTEPLRAITLTHVRAACFVRPLRPGDTIEIISMGHDDGLYFTVVGQCLIGGEVASAAVASAIL